MTVVYAYQIGTKNTRLGQTRRALCVVVFGEDGLIKEFHVVGPYPEGGELRELAEFLGCEYKDLVRGYGTGVTTKYGKAIVNLNVFDALMLSPSEFKYRLNSTKPI